jgi:glycerol-3-phosphate O-acyltransferase
MSSVGVLHFKEKIRKLLKRELTTNVISAIISAINLKNREPLSETTRKSILGILVDKGVLTQDDVDEIILSEELPQRLANNENNPNAANGSSGGKSRRRKYYKRHTMKSKKNISK